MKQSVPFAVIGSNTIFEVGGKKIRGRQYPWGIVDVENTMHSDFIKLRTMLISTHMQDLVRFVFFFYFSFILIEMGVSHLSLTLSIVNFSECS
jgi:Septin